MCWYGLNSPINCAVNSQKLQQLKLHNQKTISKLKMQNIILAKKLTTKEAATVALLFLAGAASAADLKMTGYPGDYCCSFWAENYYAGE